MRRLLFVSLVVAAPILAVGTTPSSAFGWYGYGYSRCGYYAPRVYGYSYYRPRFVYGSFYRPRAWGWRGGWGGRRWGWRGRW